jgi:hypothetical protein
MLNDYLAVGDNEVANHARLATYMNALGSPFDSGSAICKCDTLTAEILGDAPYTLPDDPDNPAPWYDPNVPESGQFLGVMILTVDGDSTYPQSRTVSTSVGGVGSLGPTRTDPRPMTFTALLLGTTCCAVAYGYQWLTQALQPADADCNGQCAYRYSCCPDEGQTADQFNAAYRRTYRRVALTSGPDITARHGNGGCGQGGAGCGMNADIVTVEFGLTAGSPWAWGDEQPLLDISLPTDDDEDCLVWCLPNSTDPECIEAGPCHGGNCPPVGEPCTDSHCNYPDPPVPGSASSCFCIPLAANRACFDLDLSTRPRAVPSALVMEFFSGTYDLRNATISFYKRSSAYDPTTEGVFADQFERSQTSGWGTSDSGLPWTNTGGTAVNFSVSGGQGHHRQSPAAVLRESSVPFVQQDIDIYYDMSFDAWPTTGNLYAAASPRWADTDNNYDVTLQIDPLGNVQYYPTINVGGVQQDPAGFVHILDGTPPPGTTFRVHWQVTGNDFAVSVWDIRTCEPTEPVFTFTDDQVPVSAGIAVKSFSDSDIVPHVDFDNIHTNSDAALTCDQISELADPWLQYNVNFLRDNSTLTLDGQVGRAMQECGGVCSPSTYVFGYEGSPPQWPVLPSEPICVCVETNALVTPSENATLSIRTSGRY